MGKNVLVVSTVEHADDVLREHFGEDDTIKVVVPVRYVVIPDGDSRARRVAQNLSCAEFVAPLSTSSTSWSAHADSHGADVRFGHPCLGKGWAQSNKRRGETNGRWCPQILRAGDRSSGAPCRRSRRRKRQGHPEGRDSSLADSPCSWCRALCVGGKWIPDTTRQRLCKSGQGARVRLARRPDGPCPPSCADVVQPEVNIEFKQREA